MAGMVNPSETYTAWSIGEGAHEVTGLKPMLNPEEQVALLKAKGVSFERCGEEQAADALARRGTFVHLASCRRLFQKHASGDDRGKYVRLDFADLLALDALDDELISQLSALRGKYEAEMEKFQFQNALELIFKCIQRANKYIDETAPWALAKDEANRARLASVMYNLLEAIRICTILLTPFIPASCEKIFARLGACLLYTSDAADE